MFSWCHKVVVTKFTWTEQAAKMHYMFSSQNPNIWKVQKNAYLIWHRKTCEYWGLALCQATEQQLNGEKFSLLSACGNILFSLLCIWILFQSASSHPWFSFSSSFFLFLFPFTQTDHQAAWLQTRTEKITTFITRTGKITTFITRTGKITTVITRTGKITTVITRTGKITSYHQNWNDCSCECQEYLNWMSHWTFQEQECEMD